MTVGADFGGPDDEQNRKHTEPFDMDSNETEVFPSVILETQQDTTIEWGRRNPLVIKNLKRYRR